MWSNTEVGVAIIFNIVIFVLLNSLLLDQQTAADWIGAAIGWSIGVGILTYYRAKRETYQED
jgi:hypothetical protein